jgi:uncharacterized protein (TIGR02646 family)
MKGARKICAPTEYLEWINHESEDWKPTYPFNDASVRSAVVHSLHHAQRGLCVYCGRKLDMSSPGKTFHIEHFRPQASYKGLEANYDNLYISCGQEALNGDRSQTCGTHKANWFDEATHVQPVYPNCMNLFTFTLNGRIDSLNAAASKMVEVLNLNHAELVKDREEFLLSIDLGELDESDFWDADSALAESYAHMAFKHCGKLLP